MGSFPRNTRHFPFLPHVSRVKASCGEPRGLPSPRSLGDGHRKAARQEVLVLNSLVSVGLPFLRVFASDDPPMTPFAPGLRAFVGVLRGVERTPLSGHCFNPPENSRG